MRDSIMAVALLAGVAVAPGGASFAAAVPNAAALDKLWVHLLYDVRQDDQFQKTTNVIAQAKSSGYTGVIFASSCRLGLLHLWSEEERERLRTVRRLCDDSGLEIAVGMWSFGYAKETFFPIDPNLSAAAPVNGTRYRVADGKCVHVPAPPRELLASPGVLHSPRAAQDVADLVVAVKPCRSYQLRIRARSEGKHEAWPISVSVRRTDAKHDHIETRVYNVKTDGGEQTFDLHFASLAEREVRIECRGYNRVFHGRAELTSMELSETEPRLVIRRHGTPITVRSEKAGAIYEEGRDYARIPKADGVWPGPWNRYKFAVKPLPGGRIKDGDELSVDCYCVFPTWGKWVSACMAAPELDPIMEASAAAVAKELNPRLWMLSYDEVRMGGGCADCRRIGDMAHIYAERVKKSMALIRRFRPDAEIMIWNDMVDPFCMKDGGANAGMFSSMKGVWDLLPPDLGIAYWTYGEREKGMAFFSKAGRRILVCAYYDEKVLKHSLEWADLALRTPGTDGIAYCTWGGNWVLLGAFGDMVRQKRTAALE